MTEPSLRIDTFLWHVRLAKTRSAAQALAEAGHIRIDGRRVDRAHCPVRVGAVLTLMHRDRVRAIRVAALPARRGPPCEAAACFIDMSGVDGAPSQS